ncbi:hypothetical protein [Thermovibrio sp.]
MDLRRRVERLEKELKELHKDNDGVFIIVREFPEKEEDEELIKHHEEELLERLKNYPQAKIIIAVVDPKGWEFQLPELGIEVKSNGEVSRYKEG